MQPSLSRLTEQGWSLPEASADGVHYARSIHGEPISYPDEGFEVLGLEGGSGFWFDHRARAVAALMLRLRIQSMWEVGSGTGAMAKRLTATIPDIIAIEPLAQGARAAASQGLTSLCGTLQDFRLPDSSLNCIGAFDVLEHLPDDSALIAEFRRVLRPGGVVLVTVPALQCMWGDEDDVAGHFRRYSRGRLRSAFTDQGFTPIAVEYLYASLIPPAALVRALPYRLGRRRPAQEVLERMRKQLDVSPAIDRVAASALAVEARASRVFPLPLGLSLVGAFGAPTR